MKSPLGMRGAVVGALGLALGAQFAVAQRLVGWQGLIQTCCSNSNDPSCPHYPDPNDPRCVVDSCGTTKTLNFLPWLPYALDPSDQNFPDNKSCAQSNRSYYDAAQTPNDIFWGWTRFFNVMDVILTKAANTTPTRLNVEALDYYNESNLGFTVEARMIYDDFRGVNVLQALRDRMSAHSYDSARVAPSANQGVPAFASSDCGSFFGDSAMLMPLSQLTAALAGPGTKFGTPPFEPMFNEIVQAEEPSLPCLSRASRQNRVTHTMIRLTG